MRFNLIKSLVKVFRVWCKKEALKMDCYKRNRNISYAIFRYSNLKKLSEYLVLRSSIFLYFCDRFSKLKRFFFRFWTHYFYIFGRSVKTKYRTFLRMARIRMKIWRFQNVENHVILLHFVSKNYYKLKLIYPLNVLTSFPNFSKCHNYSQTET